MTMLDPRKDPARRCMKVEEWPSRDRAAWEAAFAPGSLRRRAGRAARWADGAADKVRSSYGRWLTFLKRRGELDADLDPARRINEARIDAYEVELMAQDVASVTHRQRLVDLAEAIRVMAGERLHWLYDRALAIEPKPRRKKTARLCHPLIALQLAMRLMQDARDGKGQYRERLHREAAYRDGLLLAILAVRAPRRRTLEELCLGRQIVRQGDRYRLILGPRDLKTKNVLDDRLPAALTPYVDHYVEVIRPKLLQGRITDRFWISSDGTHLSGMQIYNQVCEITLRELGVRMNPHVFRDSFTTAVAIDAPEFIGLVPAVLGHTLETNTRAYNQARGIEASRRYQCEIVQLRTDLLGDGDNK